ncbi:MAG: UDP-N-acetylmuramoyl-L-alanine--D-glutamate ligase [Planctomycetaceae bacterium]|nr:UDP-N-acetylmuramoyl-L-alanine--D-glutamate ligase [Planctomycetaceae bacterium]
MSRLPTIIDTLKGRRVTVMGLGMFGGGVGAVEFLFQQEADVTVTDLRGAEVLSASLKEIDRLEQQYGAKSSVVSGEHRSQDFLDADLIVVNPAVPRSSEFLALAESNNVPLTSEMNLFWSRNPAKTIGVTGSNGKSTTTALIHSILKNAGVSCWLGGNIGQSLLPVVDQIRSDDWVVLELSSFQLEDLDRIEASPNIAVVTNLTPNHLDRHGTIEEYRRCKQTIVRWQSDRDTAVLNGDDNDVSAWPSNGHRVYFGQDRTNGNGVYDNRNDSAQIVEGNQTREFPLAKHLKVPGQHNFSNAMGAIAAALAAGVGLDQVGPGIAAFSGLPHRLQLVGEYEGRRFYNDSIATTPESSIAALQAIDAPIVLLAGGYDKKIDLSPMVDAIAENARAVALMGQTATQLQQLLKTNNEQTNTKVCSNFPESFEWAWQISRPGDAVLLSPGCASYGWFDSFVDRGRQFAAAYDNLVRRHE